MAMTLPRRKLSTQIDASVIGFGTSSVAGNKGGYGFGAVSPDQANQTLQHAFERGVRLFDTAPCYGLRESEKRLGRALTGDPRVREQIIVVDKTGVTWNRAGKTYVDNSPETTRRMLEQSLADLGSDFIDVVLIHWPDPQVPVEATMECLLRARDEGLVRAIGASNVGVEWLERARRVGPLEVVQMEMNVFNRRNADDMLATLKTWGAGFMAYGTLAKGMLAGGVKPGQTFEANDARRALGFVANQARSLGRQVEEFEGLAARLDVQPATLAAAWVLTHPGVSTALCGCKTTAHVDAAVAAAQLALDREVKQQLDQLSFAATPIFHAAMA